MAFSSVSIRKINMDGFGMAPMFPTMMPMCPPPMPVMAPCCSPAAKYMSLFTSMALFNSVVDNTFSLFNKNVPSENFDNCKKQDYSNPFGMFPTFSFIPVVPFPVFPKFNFTFPKFDFSKKKVNTPAKSYSSSRKASATSIAPKQTTSLKEVAKIYNQEKGVKLAQEAIEGLRTAEKGYCARAVKTAVKDAGLGRYESGHAYQCADIFSRNPNFKEVKVKGSDLSKLPAGCILAYNKGDAGYNPLYGHVEIKGQGKQAISFFTNNNIKQSDNVRVFVPV